MCIIKIPVDCKTAIYPKTQGQVEIEETANYTLRESNTIVIMLDVNVHSNYYDIKGLDYNTSSYQFTNSYNIEGIYFKDLYQQISILKHA